MYKSLSPLFQIFLSIFSCFLATATLAQIIPDNTLDTQVNSEGDVSEITGGQTRGDNLFHSFQDFSLQTGTEAFFNNAENIANIFSRVTGGNISNIDGLIRANGSADLFLINPAGIIFGENARLDIGGSFLASTASSILFEEAGDINIEATGDITFDGEDSEGLLGGVASLVDEEAVGDGGNVTIRTDNLTLTNGGEIVVNTEGQGNAGNINITATGDVTFDGEDSNGIVSGVDSVVIPGAKGDGGNVTIRTNNLTLTNGGEIDVNTGSQGNAGAIDITATENMTIDGESSDGVSSGVFSSTYLYLS
ncbi:MAG: filamentous hemagglutinin N-terminal domain-containing protein [Pleurocapsa sp. MO_226.B13]|nr:filamentous hemagglutinin N-terminal domain-containing protein [Pleurocapsa sp. MO_226.B13]